jgi:hypothetical protein
MSKTVFPQTVKPWVDEYEAKNDYLILDRSGVSIYAPVYVLQFTGLFSEDIDEESAPPDWNLTHLKNSPLHVALKQAGRTSNLIKL